MKTTKQSTDTRKERQTPTNRKPGSGKSNSAAVAASRATNATGKVKARSSRDVSGSGGLGNEGSNVSYEEEQ